MGAVNRLYLIAPHAFKDLELDEKKLLPAPFPELSIVREEMPWTDIRFETRPWTSFEA